jgi:anti-sigma-K factor RskA
MLETDATSLEALLAQVALGSRGAFDALYRATANRLFGICLRVLAVAVAAIVWTLQTAHLPETGAKPVIPLAHDDGTPGWLASVDSSHGTVLIVPVPSAPDSQGRVTELWLIPAGKAPRSLGLVSINKSYTVTVPEDVRAALVAGSVLAVSLESATGVPHAAPSGPIIAKGAIGS